MKFPITTELAVLAGRLLFGGYFAFSGLNHFMQTEQLSGWVGSKGFPAPELLTYFSGGQLLFGGLAVASGSYPFLGIGALASFLVVVTPVFHDFWNMEGEQKQNNMVNFLKNVALLGALLMISGAAATVFGPYSAGMGLL